MSQSTNINLIPQYTYLGNLYFSQNDVGREATINLMDGSVAYTIPTGATVKIQATKPSGLGFSVTCTYSGNVVTVVSTATMTDEAGRFPCELQVTNSGVVLGSANFMFNVERSPHPDGTTDGTADSVLNQITVAFNHAMEQIENSGGLTPSIKNALLDCFAHVAWIDDQGQTYYDALVDAFYEVTGITLNFDSLLFNSIGSTQQLTATLIPSTSQALVTWESSDSSVASVSSSGLVTSVSGGNATITASVGDVSDTCAVTVSIATVTSISAVLSGGTFYVGDPVDDIKPYLTVTATYSDSTTATVPSGSYTLSGTLSQVGANTITVSYESVTTTVSVTCAAAELVSISAVYTQSGTVYDTDALNSLKSDLVVTATYSDSTTSTVASTDYTLSGTLTVGTSTITVTYSGETTTFSVVVTSTLVYSLYNHTFAKADSQYIDTNVDLFDEDKDWSIACDITEDTALGSQAWRLLTSLRTSSPYNGFYYGSATATNYNTRVKWIGVNKDSSTGFNTSFTGRHRIVFTHTKGSGVLNFTYKNNSDAVGTNSVSATFSVLETEGLHIGGVSATPNGEFNFVGTVNALEVYMRVLTTSEINTFLGVTS